MFPARIQVTEPLLDYWGAAFAEAKLSVEQVQSISTRTRASGAEHPPSLPAMIAMARGPRRINAAAYENKPLALPPPVNEKLAREALDAMRRKLGQQEQENEA